MNFALGFADQAFEAELHGRVDTNRIFDQQKIELFLPDVQGGLRCCRNGGPWGTRAAAEC
jgi:hypothetical protein